MACQQRRAVGLRVLAIVDDRGRVTKQLHFQDRLVIRILKHEKRVQIIGYRVSPDLPKHLCGVQLLEQMDFHPAPECVGLMGPWDAIADTRGTKAGNPAATWL